MINRLLSTTRSIEFRFTSKQVKKRSEKMDLPNALVDFVGIPTINKPLIAQVPLSLNLVLSKTAILLNQILSKQTSLIEYLTLWLNQVLITKVGNMTFMAVVLPVTLKDASQ
jgi:hypothetical protein